VEAEVGIGYTVVMAEVASDFRGCEDGIREGRDSERIENKDNSSEYRDSMGD
jgi:hypothetical protein